MYHRGKSITEVIEGSNRRIGYSIWRPGTRIGGIKNPAKSIQVNHIGGKLPAFTKAPLHRRSDFQTAWGDSSRKTMGKNLAVTIRPKNCSELGRHSISGAFVILKDLL